MNPDFTTCAVINLDAIADNTAALKDHVGQPSELIAVVKANAYGHGSVQVARTALAHGASHLAVSRVDEGVALRQAGITAPVLVMGYFTDAEASAAVAHDLTMTLVSRNGAEMLSGLAAGQRRIVQGHVKIDTGMGRYGLLPEEAVQAVREMSRLPGLELEGIYTHFAVADAADPSYTQFQFRRFMDVCDQLTRNGITFRLRHVANSAAAMRFPEMHLDAVRVGLALYGMHPSDEVESSVTLIPALTLKSRIARVRILPAGSSISYGRTFITDKPTPVGLVPVGYGDGYHRALSNKGVVLVAGQQAPIIGRVCMDQFVVDLTGIASVSEGDDVVLVGAQGSARITAESVAALAGTINYEVTTSLLARFPRVYTCGGDIAEIMNNMTG